MPRIYVEFLELEQVGNHCKTMASKIDEIQSDLQTTVRQLDWDVRYESNINSTANQIARKLERYSSALKSYQKFIEDARRDYLKLDEYKQVKLTAHPVQGTASTWGSGSKSDFDWKDIIKSFGSAGSIFGIINSIGEARNWVDWGNIGVDITKTLSSIAKDYNRYNKIGRAIGTSNSTGYFLKDFFGLNKVGHASTASSASARFYNNLHNTTSPYNLSNILDTFTGKNGVITSVASWAGVALSGISTAFSNIEEQKKSSGNMSTGRVVAETISETAIDTVVTYAGGAVIGAAITAATGAVAAPAVVAVATGVAIAGINAGVEALIGQSATEWVSDTILNAASAVGDVVADGAHAVASWFRKLSFT